MTEKDFAESLDAVFVAELEETLSPAEMTRLKRKVIARVRQDWDPFEDEDPLDVSSEEDTDESETPEEDEDDYNDYANTAEDED